MNMNERYWESLNIRRLNDGKSLGGEGMDMHVGMMKLSEAISKGLSLADQLERKKGAQNPWQRELWKVSRLSNMVSMTGIDSEQVTKLHLT